MCYQRNFKTVRVSKFNQHKQSYHNGLLYPCGQCDYKVFYEGNVSVHRRSKHEGIRYQCDQCGHKCTQKLQLLIHKQTKHGEIQDMFEYDQSEHRECTRKRLDKHKIIIHEAIWHQCDICRYRSTQGIHLENHKKVKHAHKPVSLNKKTEIYAMPVVRIKKKSKEITATSRNYTRWKNISM